jgi:4-aminobutyrate aminotransferase
MTWGSGTHGSTYGGNPVSCAAALATIDLIEKELVGNAEAVGSIALESLRSLWSRFDIITDVRGVGLMIGVEFDSAEVADRVEKAAFERGALLLQAGDATIRVSPPLVITEEQMRAGLEIFESACREAAH